jgi:hypothetical protein
MTCDQYWEIVIEVAQIVSVLLLIGCGFMAGYIYGRVR